LQPWIKANFSHYTLLLFYVLLCTYGVSVILHLLLLLLLVVALFALHCYSAIRLSS